MTPRKEHKLKNQHVTLDTKIAMRLCNKSLFKIYKGTFEPCHEISNNVVWATIKGSDQPAHTRRLIRAFASSSNIL